jgi:hypothetical protein
MNYDSAPLRTPFRPLQQQMYSSGIATKDRLKDSPMDFSYDSPQREDSLPASSTSSSWLHAEDDKKRPRDAINHHQVFSFGSKESSSASSGPFLFHQPISPTIAGPDVEMSSETTPKRHVVEAVVKTKENSAMEDGNSRPISSGALTRVNRSRGGNSKKGLATSSDQNRKPRSNSQNRNPRKGKPVEQNDDWEDEEVEKQPRSLSQRMGDTMNIQYIFGGNPNTPIEKPQLASWLDPEWCLGMAQFAFNSILLLGVLWLIFGVIRTLQRDVADKVREYELGECSFVAGEITDDGCTSIEFLSEIEACSHSYHLNKCGTDGAVPALATACASWQKCSAKDPAIVGRARVTAETVAEIVNGFVDVVSWKSMVSKFIISGSLLLLVISNKLLSPAFYLAFAHHTCRRHQLYACLSQT